MLHFDLLSREESPSTAPRHLGHISPFSSPFTPRSLKDSQSNEHVVSGREPVVHDRTERPITTTAVDPSSRNSSSNDAMLMNNGDETMATNTTSLEVSFPRRTNTVIPTITVGRVYSSIRPYKSSSRRQHDWHAEDDLDDFEEDVGALSLASALVVAMESSRDDAAGFWKLSSVTDPITAMGLMRGGKVPSGQRALFVEREVAERIARGKLQIKEPENTRTKDRSAVWKRLLKPLEFLQEAVLSGYARKGSPAVTDLERQKTDRSAVEGINASRPLTFELRTTSAGRSYDHRHHRDHSTGPKHRRSSELKGREGIFRARSKRLFGDSISQEDAVSLSGKAAALAGVPTRIALELLKHMPGEFVLLSRYIGRTERSQGRRADAKRRDRPAASGLSGSSGTDYEGENGDDDAASRSETTKIRDGKKGAHVPSNNDGGRMATGVLTGADHLSAVMVHTLKGFEVVQQTGEDGKVCRFIPAFLSRSSLEDFWYAMSTLVRTNALRQRSAQRRASNQLLIAKLAALAASSGIGNGGESNAGGGASGFGVGNGEDSDMEGFEDPAEVQEVIREIQSGLDMAGNESGNDDRSTRGGLVRGAATLACGIVSLMGPIIEGVGALSDAALLHVPGGTRVLGIPELLDEVQSKPLCCLLVDCQKHNDSMLASMSKPSQGSGGDDEIDRYNEMLSTAAMWSAVVVKLSLDQLLLLQSATTQRGNTRRRTKSLERADSGNGGSRSGWQGLLTPPGSNSPLNGIIGGVLPVEVPVSKSMPGEPPTSSDTPVGESPTLLAGRESVAFFLSRFLPSLEYNGFSHLVPSHADYQKRKKALMDLAPDDGAMNLGIQLAVADDNEQAVQRSSSETDIANDEKRLPSTGLKNGKNGGGNVRGTNRSDSSTEATAETGGSRSSNSNNALKSIASLESSKKQYADGKGIILIGCCETSTAQVPKPSSPGTWWVKEGVEVGIVDGAQYMVG